MTSAPCLRRLFPAQVLPPHRLTLCQLVVGRDRRDHTPERLAIEQLNTAVSMSGGADAVVNALAKQLADHLAYRATAR